MGVIQSVLQKASAHWDAWRHKTLGPSMSTSGGGGGEGKGEEEHLRDSHRLGLDRPAPSLKDVFDVIVFDLDDTLVPVQGPISAAYEKWHMDVKRLMPQSAPYILAAPREEMKR